jgi:dimethylhistidine N-methyltransferase
VTALCADFTQPFRIPRATGRPVGFFPGSTIGNLSHAEAEAFLRSAATVLGPGAGLLIGVDLKKDSRILHAAYNDAAGVTAAFNLNLLARINRELGGTFSLPGFVHEAKYVEGAGRVEMHLRSRTAQTVTIAGHIFSFRPGETIHTENSHKYSADEFRALSGRAGWTTEQVWVDPDGLFSLQFLAAPPRP